MRVVKLLFDFFPHPAFVPFIGSIVGGEEIIIIISMLSATNIIAFKLVFIFSYLGTLVSDTAWFLLGRKTSGRLVKTNRFASGEQKVSNILNRFGKSRYFFALLITKFLYGTRIILLMYLGHKRVTLSKFLFYNSIVTLLWVTIITIIGFSAGLGLFNLLYIVNDIKIVMLTFFTFIVVVYIIRIWINKLLTRKTNL